MGWTPENGDADRQVDRRRLKRQVVLWRSLALIVATVLVTLLAVRFAHDGGDGLVPGSPYIARLPIAGVIQSDRNLLDRIDRLTREDAAQAVILQIDSPGGTYAGSEALYGALRRLAERKPVVAVLGGVAASGGYMAALASDHIVARAGSITGSVGVIMQLPRLKGLLDSLGIAVDEVRSGPLKAVPSPFQDGDAAGRVAARSIVDDLFDQFLGIVLSRRALGGSALEQVRTGRVFTGQQALPLGLIDAIGGEAEARAWLAATHGVAPSLAVREVAGEDQAEMLERLLKGVAGATLLGPQPIVDGPWAVWHPVL